MLFLDLETYSEAPISDGVYRYAEAAEIILFSYAFDDEPAEVIDVLGGGKYPDRVINALNDENCILCAHNAQFDRTVLKKYFPAVSNVSRWRDSMILAYSASLPGGLGALCEYFEMPTDKAKDKDGKRLIKLFCLPSKQFGRRIYPHELPGDWARFVEYARLDVEAMREVWHNLPQMNNNIYFWNEWHIDQTINDRGFCVDLELARAAIEVSSNAIEDCNETIYQLTRGAVKTAGQCDALIKFMLSEFGYNLPDCQKATLEKRLEDDSLPQAVKDIISARLYSSKASVKKYDVLARCTNPDGRLRGCLQFCGASRTGRWAGRQFQPQNLPRGCMTPSEVETGITAIKYGVADILYSDVNSVCSSCLRGAIIAPPGKKLVVADLSNIEGRVLAYLAGEAWKIQAFKDFDEGRGVDLYKSTYGRTFGIDPNDVTKYQRQIGKVLELAMGYMGGVGAFIAFARGFNIDLSDLARRAYDTVAFEHIEKARESYAFFVDKGLTHDLDEYIFIACDSIKRAWRAAHPATVAFWQNVENAARECIENKIIGKAGKCIFTFRDAGLNVILPSGRCMFYPRARIPKIAGKCLFEYYGQMKNSRNWGIIKTYSGKICENITQAVARDILAANLESIERAGYDIVLSVHDELITETIDAPEYNAGGLSALMATPPNWAAGLPLAAAGFESKRYKKD